METLKQFGSVPPRGLRFSIGDRNRDLAAALATAFRDLACVEVLHGDLLDVSPDAVVCPGNSFGDMGGGFDKAVDDFHGGRAQPAVMRAIATRCLGELAVGASLLVEVPNATRVKILVMAPTMRIPGMCTGVGGMSFAEAASQMRTAFASVVEERWRQVAHPAMAPYALRPAAQRGPTTAKPEAAGS